MSNRVIKFALTTLGLSIMVSCITGEVDGIGRAIMIFLGVFFVYLGYFIKPDKHE